MMPCNSSKKIYFPHCRAICQQVSCNRQDRLLSAFCGFFEPVKFGKRLQVKRFIRVWIAPYHGTEAWFDDAKCSPKRGDLVYVSASCAAFSPLSLSRVAVSSKNVFGSPRLVHLHFLYCWSISNLVVIYDPWSKSPTIDRHELLLRWSCKTEFDKYRAQKQCVSNIHLITVLGDDALQLL